MPNDHAQTIEVPWEIRKLRYALKTGAGGALALFIVSALGLTYGFTAMSGVHMLMTAHRKQSLDDAVMRLAGPVLAGLVCVGILQIFDAMPGIGLLLITAFIFWMAFRMMEDSFRYGRLFAILTILLVFYIHSTDSANTWWFMLDWIPAVAVGVCTAFVMVLVFWPGESAVFHKNLWIERTNDWKWENIAGAARMTVTAMTLLLTAISINPPGAEQMLVSGMILSAAPHSGAAMEKGWHRTLGVMLGGLAGIFTLELIANMSGFTILIVCSVVFLSFFCWLGLQNESLAYPFAQAGLVYSLVIMPLDGRLGDFGNATERLWGIAFGWAIASLFWTLPVIPRWLIALRESRETGVAVT